MVGDHESTGPDAVGCTQHECKLSGDCSLYFHCSVEADLNAIEAGRFGRYMARLATIPAIRERMARTRAVQKRRMQARRIHERYDT